MKKLIVILSVALLSGCMYQRVDSADIKEANRICERENSTVIYIDASFSGAEAVTCENRTYKYMDGRK